MSEAEAIEMHRSIIQDPDKYLETVELCEDVLKHEYSRLTKKHAHYCAAWRCNAMKKQLEQQYKIKIFLSWS